MADGSVTIKILAEDSDFRKGIQSLGDKAKGGLKAVAAAAAATGATLAGLSAAAIKVGADFEAGMSKVAAISGASESELAALTAKAEEMGAKTKFSATESAEALQYMAMAGWKTEDMLGGIEGIMNLAAASGEDLATTSDIVTDALTAFGLQASDSAHFADVLAIASSNANTNVSMMGSTFKYAAPIAGALGYSIEDTAVAIGLMANAGIKAEQAGTSLRSMLTRLADPPKDAAAALEALGVSATNADGSMRSLRELLADLRASFAGLNESQQTAYASSIAGTEAMSGLLAIVNASEADFNKLANAVDNADGAAANMAETMQDNLQGQLTILGSGLEGLGIKVYKKFETPLKEAAKTAIESVNKITESMTSGKLSASVDKLAQSMGTFIASAADFAAGALPVLINGLVAIIDHGKEIVTITGTIGAAAGAYKIAPAITDAASSLKTFTVSIKTAFQTVSIMDSAMRSATTATHLAAAGMTAMETAAGVVTGRISIATAAQYAWNTALAANPIGVVIASVAALAGGIALLTIAMGEEATETELIAERIAQVRENVDAETESRKQLAEARQETIDATFSELDYTEQLVSELEGLTDANGKVKEGFEDRAAVLAQLINDAIPGAISMTQQEGATYIQTADDLKQLIAAKRLNAAIEAGEEEYNHAVQNVKQSVEELTSIEEERTAALRNLQEVQEKYNEAIMGSNNVNPFESQLRAAEENVRELDALYQQQSETVSGYYATIAQQEMLMEALTSGSAEAIAAALDTVNYSFQYATSATKEELDQQAANINANLETVKQLYAQGMPGITAQVVAEWQALADKANAEAEKGGSESAEMMIMAQAAGILSGSPLVEGAVSETMLAAKSAAENYQGAFNSIGAAMMQGIAAGINNNRGLVNAAIGGAMNAAVTFGKRAIDSNSPSKRTMREIGLPIGQGIAVGITAATSLVNASMKGLLESTSAEAASGVDSIGNLLSNRIQNINEELARMEQEDAGRKAAKELDEHKKRLAELNEKLGKAAKKDRQKILDEIAELEADWNEKQEANQRKARQEALEAQKKDLEQQLKTHKAYLDKLESEHDKAVSEVQKKQESMAEKLADFGDLYSRNDKSGNLYLKNLDENISALERYDEILQTLVERGAPKEFMAMFADMDIETGLDFGGQLLNLGEEGFQEYVGKWEEQQIRAKEIASRFYQDELETLETEFAGKLDTSLSEVPETTKDVGKDSISGWIDGMLEKSNDLYATVRSIAKNMVREMQTELEINSPSKKTGRLIGAPSAQGIEVDFMKEMKPAYGRMREAVALETSKMSTGVSVVANQKAESEANRSRVVTNYSHTTVEKTPVIEFGGSLAGIARALQPHIKVEEKRIGKNVIKGVTT